MVFKHSFKQICCLIFNKILTNILCSQANSSFQLDTSRSYAEFNVTATRDRYIKVENIRWFTLKNSKMNSLGSNLASQL